MHPAPDLPPNRPITLICHLLAAPAIDGQLVGHVEVVATGDVIAIAEASELVELVRRAATELDRGPPAAGRP